MIPSRSKGSFIDDKMSYEKNCFRVMQTCHYGIITVEFYQNRQNFDQSIPRQAIARSGCYSVSLRQCSKTVLNLDSIGQVK